MLNNYEGLFIFNASAKEEELKEVIGRVQKGIEQAGGRVDKVQKMGERPLARTMKKASSGYYVNLIFSMPTQAVAELNAKLKLDADVYRWQFTRAVEEKEYPKRKRREKKESNNARN